MITISHIQRWEVIFNNIPFVKLYSIILIGILALLIFSNSMGIILYNSDGVGSDILGDSWGGMTIIYIPHLLEININISNIIFIIALFIIIGTTYSGFKEYLEYKRENL